MSSSHFGFSLGEGNESEFVPIHGHHMTLEKREASTGTSVTTHHIVCECGDEAQLLQDPRIDDHAEFREKQLIHTLVVVASAIQPSWTPGDR